MDRLFPYWWFWLGVLLIAEAIILIVLMMQYKHRRIQNRKQREIEASIRKTRDAMAVGHHPCRYDGGIWHTGKCTPFACPSARNYPTLGAVLYHANR